MHLPFLKFIFSFINIWFSLYIHLGLYTYMFPRPRPSSIFFHKITRFFDGNSLLKCRNRQLQIVQKFSQDFFLFSSSFLVFHSPVANKRFTQKNKTYPSVQDFSEDFAFLGWNCFVCPGHQFFGCKNRGWFFLVQHFIFFLFVLVVLPKKLFISFIFEFFSKLDEFSSPS